MKRLLLRAAAVAIAVTSALATSQLLTACAPLIVGGAVLGGTLMATDRRTSGAQIDDQAIELKSMNRIREVIGDRGHVAAVSYNRAVLLTGEVQSEADKAAVEQAVQRVDNVRSLINDLEIMGASSLTSRSNDAILSSKVKATFVDAKDVFANAFKVHTERGVVYLMGRVTEREANRATELTRSVDGVQKVVRVFEIISEAELADMTPKPARQ
jgi:osmotically-inducible protein OsmY